MISKYKKHFPYFVFIVAALLLGFSPVIFSIYRFHDDLFFWRLPFSTKEFPMICSLTLFVGRIIGAIIEWFDFVIVRTVIDLNIIRLLNSLVIAFCAIGAYGFLVKYLKRPMDAALSTVILFSLPAFEVWSFHVGQSYEVYALIFVMIALYAVNEVPLEGSIWKRVIGKRGLVSILSLVISNLIYPPLTAFYWAMALVLILVEMENDQKELRKKIENIYIPGITAILIFAFIYKFRKCFINIFFINSYQPDALTTNYYDKFLWFFQTVIPQTLNLWNIFPNNFLPVFIVLFFAGALILMLIKEFKNGNNKNLWADLILRFLIVSSLIILTYWPNLLCVVNFNPYRCGAGLAAIIVILLIGALRTYSQLFQKFSHFSVTLILCLVCLWGIVRCFDNIDRFRVKLSAVEYSFLKNSMNNFHGNLKEIYLIPATFDDFYSYYDEFGVSTFGFNTYSHVVDLINAMLVDIEAENNMKWVGLERFASPEELKYGISSPNSYNSTFKYYFKEESADVKPHYQTFELKIVLGEKPKLKLQDSTLLIDMNNLYGPFKQIMGKFYNFKIINKGSWDGKE